MKSFEVIQAITMGSKNETRIIFVGANSKKELMESDGVIKVHHRPDIDPNECPLTLEQGIFLDTEIFNLNSDSQIK